MKRNTLFRMIAVILCAACLLPLAGGFAEAGEEDILNRLRTVKDFKFQVHKDGIGSGRCSVLTAPQTNAYRSANGRASCELSGEIAEAGYHHGWLLVRYKTNNGGIRVGYIRNEETGGFQSRMPGMDVDPIPVTAAVSIPVTDGPVEKPVPFGTIEAGETFYVLRKYTYTGSWWYVECTVEGQTARGFIDRNTASFYLGAGVDPASGAQAYDLASLGYPEVSPRNTGVIGHFQVSPGDRKMVWPKTDSRNASDHITVAYPDRYYPCYDAVKGDDGRDWYYIWVEEDSKWGWIPSVSGTLVRD